MKDKFELDELEKEELKNVYMYAFFKYLYNDKKISLNEYKKIIKKLKCNSKILNV